jgi:hypothetical protein
LIKVPVHLAEGFLEAILHLLDFEGEFLAERGRGLIVDEAKAWMG